MNNLAIALLGSLSLACASPGIYAGHGGGHHGGGHHGGGHHGGGHHGGRHHGGHNVHRHHGAQGHQGYHNHRGYYYHDRHYWGAGAVGTGVGAYYYGPGRNQNWCANNPKKCATWCAKHPKKCSLNNGTYFIIRK